jgi:F0F1-type ATP synthase membrane subunit a
VVELKECRDDSTSDRSNLSLNLALSTVVFTLLPYYGIPTKPTGFGTLFMTATPQTGHLEKNSTITKQN